MNPLYYLLLIPLVGLFVLLLCILRAGKRSLPRFPVRRCGLCSTALLYDESSICGPCAVDQGNGHWGQDQQKAAKLCTPDPRDDGYSAAREPWTGSTPYAPGDVVNFRTPGGEFMAPVKEAWCGDPPLPEEDETRTDRAEADPFKS